MATIEYTGLSFDCEDGGLAPHLKFFLLDKTPEHETVAERLHVLVSLTAVPDDGHCRRRYIENYDVQDSTFSTFSPGDAASLRALLAKIVNHAMNEHDL